MLNRFRQSVSEWLVPCDTRGKILVGVAAFLALLFGIYLFQAGAPWNAALLEKLDAGKKPTPHDYGQIGLWWGALAGLGIALATVRTARWWGRPHPGEPPPAAKTVLIGIGTKAKRRIFVAGLLLAVIVGGFLRAPRLDHSLWNDEEYAVRRNVWGEWKVGKDGKERFDGLNWEEALFFNHNNNHIFHTIGARVSLGVWQKVTGKEGGEFGEGAVRFIPFLSGLGSIFLLGILGWACGIPLSGAAGAFLLTLSPWHIRYSVEARGYSSLVFFILLGMLMMIVALRSGRWRWWFAYGVCQCAFFLCFAGAVYVVVGQSIFVATYLGLSKKNRWMISRWLVASALTSIPFFLLEGPSIPQIAAYFARSDIPRIPMDYTWLRDLWSHLVAGIPWVDQTSPLASPLMGDEAVRHLGLSIHDEAQTRGWVISVVTFVFPALVVIGCVVMVAKNWRTQMVVVVLGFSAVLFYLHNALKANPSFGWYLIHLAPFFALVMPAGIEILMRGRWRVATSALLVGLVVVYGMLVWPAVGAMRDHDRQPMRQTVALIKKMASPAVPLTGVFGTSDRQVKTYDPYVRILKSEADIERLIVEGEELGRPVFVYYCGDVISWTKRQEVAERIASDPAFECVAYLKGLEAMYSYRVFRYRR